MQREAVIKAHTFIRPMLINVPGTVRNVNITMSV